MLTGMGDDGAKSLLEMREAGARTIAQDEESSVVWGMPGSAVKCGAAEQILPLEKIPSALIYLLAGKGKTIHNTNSLRQRQIAAATSFL